MVDYLNPRTMEKSTGLQPVDFKEEPMASQEKEPPQVYHNGQDADDSDVENTIICTRKYTLFKFDPINRPIDIDKVYALCTAITQKNLLHLFPIIVNANRTIIDGQHRLKAAEELGVPIYYIVSRQMTMEDAALVVQHTSKWTLAHWTHYWCAKGNLEYIRLKAFSSSHPWIPISSSARLCSKQRFLFTDFMKGTYNAGSVALAEKVCEMALDFKPWFKYWNTGTFVSALMQLGANPNYHHKHMMMKMQYLSSKLVRCATVGMYLEVISEIYSYKVSADRRVVFHATKVIRR